jgi:voltage-gated potassium channel
VDDESRGADSADTGGTDGTEAHDTDGADIREPRTTEAHRTPREPHDAHQAGTEALRTSAPDAHRADSAHTHTPDTPIPHDPDSRQARWEAHAEIPLALASLVFLAAYATLVLGHSLPAVWRDVCVAVLLATWALFALDYAVRWRQSGRLLGFVRTHTLDTLVLLLPLLRPLRVVKVYEAVLRRHGKPRLALYARVITYAGLSTVLLGFAGALAVYQQERGAPGASMRTFGDAVWWACATLTTIGYGDVVPVTPTGRLIAVGMMIIGLALLGAVTGTFASWLLQVFSREDDDSPAGP